MPPCADAENQSALSRSRSDTKSFRLPNPTVNSSLCAAVRATPTLQGIPFILVTSLSSEEHRARGLAVGADAYIVKGEFEQGTLLDAVGRLLP